MRVKLQLATLSLLWQFDFAKGLWQADFAGKVHELKIQNNCRLEFTTTPYVNRDKTILT